MLDGRLRAEHEPSVRRMRVVDVLGARIGLRGRHGDDVSATSSDTEGIACPWCGVMIEDLWVWYENSADSTVKVECDSCGDSVALTRNVSVSYTATRSES